MTNWEQVSPLSTFHFSVHRTERTDMEQATIEPSALLRVNASISVFPSVTALPVDSEELDAPPCLRKCAALLVLNGHRNRC